MVIVLTSKEVEEILVEHVENNVMKGSTVDSMIVDDDEYGGVLDHSTFKFIFKVTPND